mmetsp:Transcript_29686/g.59108  ORF Transcript_29686/g.59108 Transcript_29686/m.59108 type:complete len:211 (+) Transcript_29686:386-1018(+)
MGACSACFDDHYKANGMCVKCASNSLELMHNFLLVAIIALIVGVIFKALKCFGRAPELNFSIFTQMRVKLLMALVQGLALFGRGYLLSPRWFKRFMKFLMDISMPLEVNTACLGTTKVLESRRLSFLSGWLASFVFSLLICFLLNVHRLQPNKSNSDPRIYENIQKVASILCSSAVLYIVRVFLDFEEIGANLRTMESEVDQAVADEVTT